MHVCAYEYEYENDDEGETMLFGVKLYWRQHC